MKKFKAGDRVIVKDYIENSALRNGELGTVLPEKYENLIGIAIRFDTYNPERHSCGGACKAGYGWWIPEICLEPYAKPAEPRVGDRIKMITDRNSAKKGMTGTIVGIKTRMGLPYAVRFDTPFIGAHRCAGACESDRGHWCAKKDFKVIAKEERKIVITSDGETTTARLYKDKKLLKTAQATCSPDDDFDLYIGAALALDRLTGIKDTDHQI